MMIVEIIITLIAFGGPLSLGFFAIGYAENLKLEIKKES